VADLSLLALTLARRLPKVSTQTPLVILYIVPWTKLSYLDEHENAPRIVREATEDH
jgi:hypothetical protein